MSLLLAALLQVGPFVTSAAPPISDLPKEVQQRQAIERKRAAEAQSSEPLPPQPGPRCGAGPEAGSKLAACLELISVDPDAAADAASGWLGRAKGSERAEAGQALGSAQVAQQKFAEAAVTFQAARDAAAPSDHALRARLGAMAGNAELADGKAEAALGLLDIARADAGAAPDLKLASGIAADRASALVVLKRDAEAATALADARASDPASSSAWLLSATLSRRMGKLAEAQSQIEEAARLRPIDPEIGLEAGVIAVLAGHDEAARKSWQSVLAMAPQSEPAATAKTYIAQLAPAPAPVPPAIPAAGR